jgi:hypothetical protein
VVDGNCMMDSFGDAVRMDVLRMSEPSGAMMRGPSQRGLALAALCPVVAVVAAGACLRGRKRRTR